jgi:SAM-dependent methyltransferase
MKDAIKGLGRIFLPARFRPGLEAICAAYKRVFYFGFRYKCPFCNSRLRTFLPFGLRFPVLKEEKVVGGGYRQNALCPICGSFDRERLLYLFLLRKTDVFEKPQKLLHVAPEARVADILRAKVTVDYLTADIAAENVMVKMDITDIRFPDDSFDAIICNHVLEHVIDDRKAMAELYRALKPGGWGVLQVPLSLSLKNTYEDALITTITGREEAFGQGDHVRIYAKDYQDRLAQAGFRVSVFEWVNEAESFGGGRNVFGLNEEECVYFVSKDR